MKDTCTTTCGDGKRAGAEQCDDSNLASGDGCSATCTIEPGYSCSGGSPTMKDTCVQSCAASCGDGKRDANEGCDDANSSGGDGCSDSCMVEAHWSCTPVGHSSRDACKRLKFCGDGVVQAGEECDGGGACTSMCTVNPPQLHCGDGTLDAGETCDDANTVGGDGCSAACVAETDLPWVCDAMHPGKKKRACKVDICHATSSYSNPYVLISVDDDSLKSGHGDHNIVDNPNFLWSDIIPAPAGGCPGSPCGDGVVQAGDEVRAGVRCVCA
jgi:cysteine-rich repeat protein